MLMRFRVLVKDDPVQLMNFIDAHGIRILVAKIRSSNVALQLQAISAITQVIKSGGAAGRDLVLNSQLFDILNEVGLELFLPFFVSFFFGLSSF